MVGSSAGRLRIVLRNETRYRTEDLRRILERGLRANGVGGVVRVRVVPAPARSRGCAQVACTSRGRTNKECEMVLAVGPQSYQSPDAFRRRLSRLIDHEAKHMKGAEHADMSERDLYSLGPTSSWANGTKLRKDPSARSPRLPPMTDLPSYRETARDPTRPKATRGSSGVRLYWVYVVEMLAVEAREPGRRPRVYVGSSAERPSARLAAHRRGGLAASGRVRRDGQRLRADLAPRRAFSSREEARRAEQRTARDLTRRGYEVVGACRPRRDRGCAAL